MLYEDEKPSADLYYIHYFHLSVFYNGEVF